MRGNIWDMLRKFPESDRNEKPYAGYLLKGWEALADRLYSTY